MHHENIIIGTAVPRSVVIVGLVLIKTAGTGLRIVKANARVKARGLLRQLLAMVYQKSPKRYSAKATALMIPTLSNLAETEILRGQILFIEAVRLLIEGIISLTSPHPIIPLISENDQQIVTVLDIRVMIR
jgi:hypothetical protein